MFPQNVGIIFVVAPCILIVLSLVQLMHTNFDKIVKQLKSFKIIILNDVNCLTILEKFVCISWTNKGLNVGISLLSYAVLHPGRKPS